MAQNSRGKKTSAGKKKAGNSKKKKSNSSQISIADVIFKREVGSTLAFAAGILLLIIALFEGGSGSVWNSIHSFYFFLFGLCGYYIPFAVLFLGAAYVLNRQKKIYWVKSAELMLFFAVICAFFYVNNLSSVQTGLFSAVKNIFEASRLDTAFALESGGFIGALAGGGIFQLVKSVRLANVILIFFLITDLMFLFGITLFKLLAGIEKPAKKVGEFTGEAIEKTKSDYEKFMQMRAEKIANRRNVDPVRILDDFYSGRKTENEQTAGIITAPETPDKIKDGKPAAEAPERDIFSLIEENAQSAFESETTADSISASIEAAVPNYAAAEKKDSLKPLSEQENNELNNALNEAAAEKIKSEYHFPPLECLVPPKQNGLGFNSAELKMNGDKLIAALSSFNVSASIVGVIPGPTVTRYELSPAPGVKISKFVGLADDLALHMASPAGLRIEAPIPNKAAIGIEIPNRTKNVVTFREVIDTEKYRNSGSKLCVALGKDISGSPVFSNISKMPHLLVAGTTGSGKSVCLNAMIVSLLYNASPDEVKLLLIDPKQVEFGVYNGLPHLLVPVVSDPRKASGALGWAVTEMLSRYKTLNANGVRDIGAYNSLCDERDELEKMSHIVIFIDELSDLMTVAPAEVEDSIQRLAQMARAAGMHLVVATQRPSVDVITGVIKANIPSRIALTVKSQIDSRTIIDSAGAEKLMGNGDMLYYPVGIPKPVRVQGCYLSDAEIENVVSFIKSNGTAAYDDNVQQEIDRQAAADKKKNADSAANGIDTGDELFMRAVELIVGTPEKASISALQRHLGLGFAKAGRLMDTLEQRGIVGPHMGSKPRNVLISKAQWYEMNALSQDTAPSQDISQAEDSALPAAAEE